MFSVPDSVVVRRPFTLKGVKVPTGTSLTKDQVVALGRELDALLDNGTLVATPDPFARKNKQPQPTSLPPVIRNAMLGKLKSAAAPLSIDTKAAALSVAVTITGGLTKWDVDYGDGSTATVATRTASHVYKAGGTYTVTCKDSTGQTAIKSLTVTEPPAKGK